MPTPTQPGSNRAVVCAIDDGAAAVAVAALTRDFTVAIGAGATCFTLLAQSPIGHRSGGCKSTIARARANASYRRWPRQVSIFRSAWPSAGSYQLCLRATRAAC